ncbi:GNAT family N-acetyltransferase [Kocuria sp.]|uniref:GNAT family N-acetyltransferase n=1 Tax=Kocuria sp. TaxID=1871328 RepID=UPI0026DF1DE1|nr:GNAT family N-acetyltransferase [Kocuria sp.]MDO5617431.1 GNAT family N-acetyltransferase [Kocuria sp.]
MSTEHTEYNEPQVREDPELKLVDNQEKSRVELWNGATFIGFVAVERLADGTVDLQHTIIDERFSRQGYARTLITLVLDTCRASGVLIHPTCTYVQDYLQRFPQYQDLVA